MLKKPLDIFAITKGIPEPIPDNISLRSLIYRVKGQYPTEPARVRGCTYVIKLKDPQVEPIVDLNPIQLQQAAELIEDLRLKDIVQPGIGAWSRSFTLIRNEKDGLLEMSITRRRHLELTEIVPETRRYTVKEVFDQVQNHYVSILNFIDADNLLPIEDAESRERSAVVLEKEGLFEFKWVNNKWYNFRAYLNNFLHEVLKEIPSSMVHTGKIIVFTPDERNQLKF